MSQLPALIPTTLILAGLLSLLVGLRSLRAGHLIALTGTVVSFLVSVIGLLEVTSSGQPIRYALGGWIPPIGIEFVLDHLAAYMTTLVTGIGVLVLIYAPRSIRHESPGKAALTYPSMALLVAGLAGMSITGDLFNLYVFLEIAALAAYALLATGRRGGAFATLRYLLIGAVGGGFYLLGVGFIYFSVGSINMADVAARLPELLESRSVISGAVLMVLGLALKMGLFPLHFWMPDVYTNAPSSSAALIAPIMTKVSAYAIVRLMLDVFPPGFFTEALPIAATIGWMSAAGILFGSIIAIGQQDYRRMLAYSSVGQIAYVGLGIALANPIGLIGGLLHIVNHALMKGLLFLIGGAIQWRTGLVRIPDMVGLGKKMPWTMYAFVIAVLAMVGIPPTAGFFSKVYLMIGAVQADAWVWFAVIVLSSLLSAIYFFRMVEFVFRDVEGAEESADDSATGGVSAEELRGAVAGEVPPSMFIPIAILSAAVILVGVFNFLIVRALLEPAVAPLLGG